MSAFALRCVLYGMVDMTPSVLPAWNREVSESLEERLRIISKHLADAPALAAEVTLSFREVELYSARIAHRLRRDTPLTPIATLLPQTAGGLLVLVGVLRSGRPLVPLDIQTPPARIDKLIRDSGAGAVIVADAETELAAQLIDLDELWGAALTSDAVSSLPSAALTEIAAIMYTSGSSGEPKGVACTHGQILNDAAYAADAFGLVPSDRIGLLLPHSFGAGLFMFVFALLNGACTCPYEPRQGGLSDLCDRVLPASVRELS